MTLRKEPVTAQAVPLLEKDEKASLSKADRAIMGQAFKAEDVYLNTFFKRVCFGNESIIPVVLQGLL